jgi:hypothetical protein
MSVGLAQRQLESISWSTLRVEGGWATDVPSDLQALLFVDAESAEEAYLRLTNSVVCQGSTFRSAPAVVSVIMAALTDESIPALNMRQTIDLLGRLVGGRADRSEVAEGYVNIREECATEALRGYWSLVKVALTPDPYRASQLASELLRMLDSEHASRILTARGE